MYLFVYFCVEDYDQLFVFMYEYVFVMLVIVLGGVFFVIYLLVLVQQEGGMFYLCFYFVCVNKQWQYFGLQDVLVIFQGLYVLIDLVWYVFVFNVFIWNYLVVYVYGQVWVVEGEQICVIVFGLVECFMFGMVVIFVDFEWWMLVGVVIFEIVVMWLEGKDKLSQNKLFQDCYNVV